MSEHVGFRLGKTDQDITTDLKRFSDRTARMKEVYRLAMRVEAGEYLLASEALHNYVGVKTDAKVEVPRPALEPTEEEVSLEPLVWQFPEEVARKELPKSAAVAKANVLANLRAGF